MISGTTIVVGGDAKLVSRFFLQIVSLFSISKLPFHKKVIYAHFVMLVILLRLAYKCRSDKYKAPSLLCSVLRTFIPLNSALGILRRSLPHAFFYEDKYLPQRKGALENRFWNKNFIHTSGI